MQRKKPTIELIKTVHMVKRLIDSKISGDIDENLTVPQAHVIGYIYDHGKSRAIFQRDLEDAFELHRSSVSLMLNNMEKNGYIQRVSGQQDGRLKKIVLTEKGLESHKEIHARIQTANDQIMDGISQEEKEVLMETLAKIQSNLK